MKAHEIYFDYNATTRLDPAVLQEMQPFFCEVYGNPSSVHQVGRRARALLDEYRDRLALHWKCKPSEVVFTSGGTEANNLAIFGTARLKNPHGRHLITSSVEHHAVLHSFQYLQKKEGFELTILPVDSQGRVDPTDVQKAIRKETVLVSIMAANNEIGTIQPISEIGKICRTAGVTFHTDAVQWFGKLPVESVHQFEADLVTCCPHKFHGPKGVGALFIRSPLLPEPVQWGGAHENERRAGTENLAGISGLVRAVELFTREPVFPADRLKVWSEELAVAASRIDGTTVHARKTERLPNTISFSVAGTDSIALMAGLDLEGVCASSGSACSAGSLEPSHVITALGVSPELANALVRFSLGRENTAEEVKRVTDLLPGVIERLRS
jgi:cysteine desulfurase